MKHYTHLIWDFNGTLLDDVETDLLAANELLRRHGLPLLADVEAYRAVFGFPIVDYYRRIGFDFEKTPYNELAIEWVEIYQGLSRDMKLYPSALPLLREARERGIPQSILSATHREILAEQVRQLGIETFFDELMGLDNIHAHSKTALAVAWRERNPTARPLFLGDTEHDLDTARAMGADCILVAEGHRPRAALEAAGALTVLSSLSELSLDAFFV